MKTANVSLDNLLDQLSEDRINLVVDKVDVVAGSGSCKSHSSKSSKSCSKSSKSKKSCSY